MSYQYLYGPIPSRRLGVSLGVDPIPYKTCPLNCIYCECGATNNFTKERKEYIPMDKLLAEIEDFLAKNHAPDYITFSGSGEPTLHSRIGEMLRILKNKYPHIKTAVLTNSIMLFDPNLQNELLVADLVCPSLDAVSEDTFRRIDVPVPGIDISAIPYHLKKFAQTYQEQPDKQLWIEIFVIDGINNTPTEISAFIEVLKEIPYTRIQLNRLDRIGTVRSLIPTPIGKMDSMKDALILGGLHDVEVISKCKKREEIRKYQSKIEEVLLATLGRRSHSMEDLLDLTGLDKQEELEPYLDLLTHEKKVHTEILEGRIVYSRLPL